MAAAELFGRLGVGELLFEALEAGVSAPHQLRHPGAGNGIGLQGGEGFAEAGGQWHHGQLVAFGLGEVGRIAGAGGGKRQAPPYARKARLDQGAHDHVGAGGGIAGPVFEVEAAGGASGVGGGRGADPDRRLAVLDPEAGEAAAPVVGAQAQEGDRTGEV